MTREKSLIIGASGGIGSALDDALATRGDAVTRMSRSADGLDVTDEASVAQALGALDDTFDRIVVATGALQIDGAEPEKTIRALNPADMAAQFALNAIGPALILKHALPLVPRDRRSVVAVLSARVGSIGDNNIGGWISYRAAKAALNQIVRTSSIELKRLRKQAICVSLHPGTVQTSLTGPYLGRHRSVAPDEAAQNLLRVMDGVTVEETGHFFDWAGNEVAW
ncbi:SDR family NAD(P)-dependent oxidoreductase [Nioella nitratireducens]|uniref:SDR family NAD(P)-dependent oxidoreductase n=1 Tax=Nioella nitratireducens TaxID=1287720 RepID=UPI0008FCE6A1|nr:SDR family NAD(P)-dependent oxidoreductase [Nioella nitratireducens]